MREFRINVRYADPQMPKLEYIPGGNWIDLCCQEDVNLKAGESMIIPLGVSIELPDGYEAIVAPRSSTFKRYKMLMANSIGIIDSSYCGDNDIWGFPAYATEDVHIPKHTRIAQFRILYRQPQCEICEVATHGNKDRGGFGSTGI